MSDINQASQEKGMEEYFFRAAAADFKKIPGSPIAYWASDTARSAFVDNSNVYTFGETREGMTTGSNDLFLRLWQEVNLEKVGHGFSRREDAKNSQKKWFPYNKGGNVIKWYGNACYLVDWFDDGLLLQTRKHPSGRIWAHNFNLDYVFKESISWTAISNKGLGFRYFPNGFLFDANGLSYFPHETNNLSYLLALLNSSVAEYFAKIINSSMKYNAGDIGRIPIKVDVSEFARTIANSAISLSKEDWDSFEISWDFRFSPLITANGQLSRISEAYSILRGRWNDAAQKIRHLEEENNRIFIDAYGLQDELKPDVPLSEITLTCNPHYRYGDDKTEQELEDLLRADTMREFISYAVGCMFGRYSLDKPGLILANQGETLEDYLRQVPEPRFTPDADNVIPLLDGDWFPDDITGRFRDFLRVTFGDEHYEENLRFIETALGKKGKPLPIRDFFLKEFYADHVKLYKKRPIYWLFSSPKGSFNALIYLHRYRPDTASVVLQYLRDFRSKLAARRAHLEQVSISTSASQGEKTKALNEIEILKKTQAELDDYERDTLYPLATRQESLDLDDGVKVNYIKLGAALKKIPGLDAKDEE